MHVRRPRPPRGSRPSPWHPNDAGDRHRIFRGGDACRHPEPGLRRPHRGKEGRGERGMGAVAGVRGRPRGRHRALQRGDGKAGSDRGEDRREQGAPEAREGQSRIGAAGSRRRPGRGLQERRARSPTDRPRRALDHAALRRSRPAAARNRVQLAHGVSRQGLPRRDPAAAKVLDREQANREEAVQAQAARRDQIESSSTSARPTTEASSPRSGT